MCVENILYSAPIVPIFTRGLLCLWHHCQANEILSEEEHDKEAHRNHILALSGFSFTGLLAIAVLDTTLRQDFHFAVYFLLISFLSYFFSLNMQGYKSTRFHDQFATALMDSASLSLILSIVSIINTKAFHPEFALWVSGLAIFVWAADHLIRLRIQWKYLNTKKECKGND
ncbi:MAG: hypothetical protein MUO63_09130 [Desulfobulbaceae bacterium]|nr:hypothetical protein [Desulfobulbaceae bacterium]